MTIQQVAPLAAVGIAAVFGVLYLYAPARKPAPVPTAAPAPPPKPKPPPEPALSVLPFDDVPAPLMDAIFSRVTEIPKLRVIRGPNSDAKYVLTGSAKRSQRKTRLTIQLGSFTQGFDATDRNLDELPKQVAQAVAAELKLPPPVPAAAHFELALKLLHIGLLDQALAEANQAARLDPGNLPYRFRVGTCLLYLGRYRDAVDIFDAVDPVFDPRLWYYEAAWAHLELHETTRASQYINGYLDAAPNDPGGIMSSMQALLQARFRNDKQANAAIQEALASHDEYPHFHHTEYNIACAYALMGNTAETLHWLSEAIHDGFPCTPLFRTDPNLRSLAQNPDFQKLLAESQQIASAR